VNRILPALSHLLAIPLAFFTPQSGASPNAKQIDSLYKITLYVALVIFVLVEGALGYALYRFRARKGAVAAQIHGNTRLEIGWTVGAAVILLAEQDPAAARRELSLVLDGDVPVLSYLTRVEAHLLDALACRDLGDERASQEAAEQALNLAEPDRLILPFAMTGAWRLLEALPPHGTSHAALVTDILDAIRGGAQAGLSQPAMMPVEELSRSELRVLRYLPTNLTRREIAGELSVSLNTVDTHIRRIYAKLGAADRTAAVERGRELRLLSVGRT